jgi:hypothetical protein
MFYAERSFLTVVSITVLTVDQTGTGLEIQYPDADYLDVSINSYVSENEITKPKLKMFL